jgi:hypothetical protein
MLRVTYRPKDGSTIDGFGCNRLHELADLVRNAAKKEEDGHEDDNARKIGGWGDIL